jgi:transglutaminase-like putative cysteine protease
MANEREAPKHEVRREPRAVRVFRTCFPLLVVLWALLVLYPNPLRLAASVRRLANPGVDPVAVESLAASLPSDPAAIERAVLETLPYRYDWRVYGMPWYFPTVGEALENGEGDCKARAIVLASVLEAKGIPYRIDSSPTHVWVDYDGKVDNSLENPGAGFYEVDPQTGAKSLHLPKISITEVMGTFWEGFWPPMPVARKALLISGLAILVAIRVIWPRMGEPAAGDLSPDTSPHCATDRQDKHQRPSHEESQIV